MTSQFIVCILFSRANETIVSEKKSKFKTLKSLYLLPSAHLSLSVIKVKKLFKQTPSPSSFSNFLIDF